MRSRTLVGRVAAVQVLTLAAMLVAVISAGFIATRHVLARQFDRELEGAMQEVARKVRSEGELTSADATAIIGRTVIAVLQDRAAPIEGCIEVEAEREGRLALFGSGPCLVAARSGQREPGVFQVSELPAGRYIVRAYRSHEREERALVPVVRVLTLVAVIVVLVAALLSRTVVARALAPLSRMAAQIGAIRPGSGARLGGEPSLAELRSVASSFDGMLEKVDEALARERRFAAEASHELRTPLTVLRAEIETIATGPGGGLSASRALRSVDDLACLAEALLWLSRAQARLPRDHLEVVDLSELVGEQIEALRLRHPGRTVLARLPEEALVPGDEHLLGRAVGNLIDNALKYSGAGAPVEVEVRCHGETVSLTVVDHGYGVAADSAEHIFEPFYRGGKERAESTGFGLGLSLARAVARAHGGEVVLSRTSPSGSCFELHVPRLPPA